LGGDRFGGIWDPGLAKPMSFRVLSRFSSTPAPKVCLISSLKEKKSQTLMPFLFSMKQEKEKGKDRDTVLLNESAVLSEIVRMGEGLILG
jgi:U3 small nucleolar RNA-associated protein 22